jgi:hypothetical protein
MGWSEEGAPGAALFILTAGDVRCPVGLSHSLSLGLLVCLFSSYAATVIATPHNDTFTDDRLLSLCSAVPAVLLLFGRPRVRERYGLLYKSSCQKNTSPSTGRREDFRDIQRFSAWKTLVGCPWIDFASFLLSRCIFYMVATTPIGFRNYAGPAVVRCQPWAYRRFVA